MSTVDTLNTINELTQYAVTAVFKDEHGNLVTPTYVNYKLLDEKTNTEIIPLTPITVVSGECTIIIPANKNTCIGENNTSEYKKLIIIAIDLVQTVHKYIVKRI